MGLLVLQKLRKRSSHEVGRAFELALAANKNQKHNQNALEIRNHEYHQNHKSRRISNEYNLYKNNLSSSPVCNNNSNRNPLNNNASNYINEEDENDY